MKSVESLAVETFLCWSARPHNLLSGPISLCFVAAVGPSLSCSLYWLQLKFPTTYPRTNVTILPFNKLFKVITKFIPHLTSTKLEVLELDVSSPVNFNSPFHIYYTITFGLGGGSNVIW